MGETAEIWRSLSPIKKITATCLAVFTPIATLVGFVAVFLPDQFKIVGDNIAAALYRLSLFIVSLGAWPGLALGLVLSACSWAWYSMRKQQLEGELSTRIPYQKEKRGRWGDIKRVRFGHIDYFPLLQYHEGYKCTGLAITILHKLFGELDKDKIIQYERKDTWETISDNLANKRYDILATPIFATFERSKRMRFTMPIFYCNIGLFVNKKFSEKYAWAEMAFEDMIDKISSVGDVIFITVGGEISEKMYQKYFEGKKCDKRSADTDIYSLFDQMADDSRCLAIFCDSFYSIFNDKVRSGKITNALKSHELLYPLSFALHIGDYQLPNFLNIRLLQLAAAGGAIRLLEEEIRNNRAEYGKIEPSEIYDHFVAEWPYNPDTQVEANA